MSHRRLVWLALLVGVAVAPGAPARADSADAKPATEAWYATPPTCALPVGCGPTDSLPPVSRYPAGTLHVGLTGGAEDSRSYVRLGLDGFPSDATVTGGSLTIPVAGSDAGTLSPETAQVVACFVTSAVTDSEGTFATPPATDCSASAPAKYAPGPPATLTVDLAPFVSRWSQGDANNGIALVPAPGAGPGTTWHVAFAKGTSTATIEYLPPVAEPTPSLEATPVPDDSGGFGALPIGGDFTPAAPASVAAPIVAEAQRPVGLAPVASVVGPGFAYPVVFVIPLLLLGLGGYLGWALTRPVLAPVP